MNRNVALTIKLAWYVVYAPHFAFTFLYDISICVVWNDNTSLICIVVFVCML